MTRLLILLAAVALAAPAAASAATDGTSNTLMTAERHRFMDYTDDALLPRAR